MVGLLVRTHTKAYFSRDARFLFDDCKCHMADGDIGAASLTQASVASDTRFGVG